MANITGLVNSMFDAANAVASGFDDYTKKQAELSTRTKSYQLQSDVDREIARIKQSSTSDKWNEEINGFFESIKGEMSNPESPYYCRNNLQAQQFDSILGQSQVNVSNHVNNMVIQRQREERNVNTQNTKAQIAQMCSGQEYIDRCNDLDRLRYESGDIGPEEYQAQKDLNFMTGYRKMHTDVFDASFTTAIQQGKSKEAFWEDIKNAVPQLKASDIKGLEKVVDTKAMDEDLKRQAYQFYNARLSDIQQSNANKLSERVQQMRQQSTAEGKLRIAQQGQRDMNGMLGLQLSETDRDKYSRYFDLGINGKGNGSGTGSGSKKPDETFANFCKAQPGEALQMVINNDSLCPYDAAQIVSDTMVKEWFTGTYKENYDKDYQGRLKDYKNLYEHATSVNTVTDAMLGELIKRYPTAANYLDKNCKALITDIQNNPKEYGEATAGELADFMRDWILSAPAKATDDDFVNALKTHVNNCYIERCKQIELKDNGKLKETFNAKKPADIAKAAKLASEKDYVFTDMQGNERWAKGKKEALEAPGGVVNVLQNAVVGTLGIPESDYNKLGFYYQRDESGHDMTSKPIITYGDKAYEVIANDDEKGFKIREYAVDKNGKMLQTRELEGKAGGKLQQVMRKEQKADAKETVQDTGINTAKIKKQREAETNEAITSNTSYPKAMQAAGKVDKDTWNDYKDLDTRTYNLRVTANRMDSDAKNMSEAEFKKKYNISKEEWTKDKVESRRFNLILKS